MNIQRVGLSVAGASALVGLVLAGATAWLALTSPVTVAEAVSEGDVTPLVRGLATVLLDALNLLLTYL